MEPSPQHVVGVISDTHGLVRPEAIEKLCGCDLIVHCGDIGALAVLDSLRVIVMPVSLTSPHSCLTCPCSRPARDPLTNRFVACESTSRFRLAGSSRRAADGPIC